MHFTQFLHQCTHSPHFLWLPASLHFTHLLGQFHAPLSSQCMQTHSAKPHSFLSCTCIPPVSNSPRMPSVCWPVRRPRVSAKEDHCRLSVFSPLSAPHFGDIHVIYFMTEDSIWIPFPHQSHATQLLSPYLLECPFYNTSGRHNTSINSTVSVFLPTETRALNSSRQRKWLWKNYYSLLLRMSVW